MEKIALENAHLSRVEVDTSFKTMQKLKQLQDWHSWVESSFTNDFESTAYAKDRKRHLWRIDSLKGKNYMIVVSQSVPNLKKLEKFGVRGTAVTKNYASLLKSLSDGQLCRFKLVANPVMRDVKSGSFIPLFDEKDQKEWLLARSEYNGFEIVKDGENYSFGVTEVSQPPLQHKNDQLIHLIKVTYEGILKIKDAATFTNTLLTGLGREKAYGFGLMTVIPFKKTESN